VQPGTYFDHNATTPLLPHVADVVVAAMHDARANPHAQYRSAQNVAASVDRARRSVARVLQADPNHVVFTSGATESNGHVLGMVQGRGDRLVSAIEHPSVAVHADRTIPVDRSGVVRLDALDALLTEAPARLVSVMGANNETGVVQPVLDVVEVCRSHGVPVHCDASQMPGRVSLDVLSAPDFVTLSGHKMGGPRGVGVLVARRPIDPLHRGGPQERGQRAGTVNTPGVLGFTAALEAATPMSAEARDALEAVCIELGADILGRGAPRLPNTVCALFDVPGDVLVMALDLAGFAVSTGSACSSGAHKQSAVVTSMGRTGAPVRFSLGPDSDISQLVRRLPEVVTRVRAAF